MITTGTTLGAAHFITGTITTEVETRAAKLTETAVDLAPIAAEIAAALTVVPAQPPGLLRETTRLLEGTLNHAVRAARARAPSAATTMAERPGVIPLVGVPVSVAEEHVAAEDRAAVAAIGNPSVVMFLVVCRI
jgi:hypothetical protein